MNRFYSFICILLATFGQQGFAREAIAIQRSKVYQEPNSSSSVVLHLNKDALVWIKERKRGWYLIKTDMGRQGWVKLINLKFARTESQSSGTGNSVLYRSLDTSVATGVRGLGREEAEGGLNRGANLQQLESFRISEAEARRFAKRGQLRPTKIEYINDE